jgi:cytoskeletal protein CcmA (bactofilin family)
VEAGQRIEIFAPAQVIGDISAPTVTIDSGVVFNGNCQMHALSKNTDSKSVPPQQTPAAAKEADQG